MAILTYRDLEKEIDRLHLEKDAILKARAKVGRYRQECDLFDKNFGILTEALNELDCKLARLYSRKNGSYNRLFKEVFK